MEKSKLKYNIRSQKDFNDALEELNTKLQLILDILTGVCEKNSAPDPKGAVRGL